MFAMATVLATGTVNGRCVVGGLIGLADRPYTIITNVHTTATLNAVGSYRAAGLVGMSQYSYGTSNLDLAYFDGLINFSDSGLYDYFGEGNMFALSQYLYYNSETVHPTSTVLPREGSDLTSAQMKQQASYVGFDFDNTWMIYEGQTTPILRSMEGLFDSDGDGYYNNEDAFPGDATRWLATPEAFPFTSQTGVAMNTEITSNTITVSGISVATPISIAACTNTSCEYKINAGLWRSDVGRVKNGDTVQVRQTASGNYGTETRLTLTIGDVTGTFSVTTEAAPVDEGDGSVDDGTTPPDDSDGVTEEDTTQSTASGGGGGAFGLWFLALLLPLLRRRRVV